MIALPRPRLPDGPRAARACACLALAAGLGVWGAILPAPSPGLPPPALGAPAPRAADNGAVALWFGKDQAISTQISVLGVIAAGPEGAAVLSVDGGPPVAVRAGAEAAPGIVLRRVAPDAVLVEQAGRQSRLAAPEAPAAPGGIMQAPR
ncbi:general secretion pathway protein GspC [Achromobacter sp. Marseille-Q4962]|uniref:general secretion pathway protein GspC n=1 Tax=Achromobacter sp. Marseille-Q4962 TaxID=2942202 RepID=UPI0020730F1E|nr:general secretion pathway protein GspC [Achromobacter sp. Marseille-Q4962]